MTKEPKYEICPRCKKDILFTRSERENGFCDHCAVRLIENANERSIDAWSGPITKDNFKLFAEHWIKTAEQIRDEFTNENLNDTAKEMQKIIDIQKKGLNNGIQW